MRRSFLVAAAVIVATGMLAQDAFAQSNRMKNRIGIHVGLLGDPFPTLIGFNANYNLMDWARVTAGYGSISVTSGGGEISASTFGFGGRFFVPDWNFSPVVGLSFATVSVTITGVGVTDDVGGFTGSGSHLYATFGFDWQTGMGFSLGAGYNWSLKSNVGGLPYVNLGWYF